MTNFEFNAKFIEITFFLVIKNLATEEFFANFFQFWQAGTSYTFFEAIC